MHRLMEVSGCIGIVTIVVGKERGGEENNIPRLFDASVLQRDHGVFDGEDLVICALVVR